VLPVFVVLKRKRYVVWCIQVMPSNWVLQPVVLRYIIMIYMIYINTSKEINPRVCTTAL
jgi:hypothetical protein